MSKHSPTPWTATTSEWSSPPHIRHEIFDGEWDYVGCFNAPDDAEFVRDAVNLHQELVEALEAVANCYPNSDASDDMVKAVYRARAVLQKAKP